MNSFHPKLMEAWIKRLALRQKADKYWSEAEKLEEVNCLTSTQRLKFTESDLNSAIGSLLYSKADLQWYKAISEIHGDIRVVFEHDGTCLLSNGEIYPSIPDNE